MSNLEGKFLGGGTAECRGLLQVPGADAARPLVAPEAAGVSTRQRGQDGRHEQLVLTF